MTLPLASVVNLPLFDKASQLRVPRVSPPDDIDSPPLKVEVAWDVSWIAPPMTFNPPAVSKPAVPTAAIPELKVLVALVPPTFNTPWIVDEAPIMAEDEALSSPPTCRFAEKVEEALDINPALKVCNAVQVLGFVRFNEATTSPVVGVMVNVPSELATEETPVTKHEPFLAKQPSVRFSPLFSVEVAPDVNWMLPPVTLSPP